MNVIHWKKTKTLFSGQEPYGIKSVRCVPFHSEPGLAEQALRTRLIAAIARKYPNAQHSGHRVERDGEGWGSVIFISFESHQRFPSGCCQACGNEDNHDGEGCNVTQMQSG